MNLLKAVQTFIEAQDALRKFEAENPNDLGHRWETFFGAKCDAEEALRAAAKVHAQSPGDNAIRTVGDLRHVVARLDEEDVSDDMPLARRISGGQWSNGFDQFGEIELVTYGEGADQVTFRTGKDADPFHDVSDDKIKRGTPFKALAFD